ncbi:cdc42 effector protein 3-like [Triplophysa rosa]|uniref:cdc42 effector protein 3-like n=1 Tax=Triplophysa rosa TaxID=992332 RepID=UPI0025460C46|nr:cdc42 effector protein 3-like [Triplophysa rosa]
MIKMPLRTSLQRKPASGRWTRRSSNRRDVLSVNMISLPLADFRHLSHISPDSHMDRSFGDLSFLKTAGNSLVLQSSQSEQNLFLACGPPPKPPRLNPAESRCSPVWEHAPVNQRQKCSSMPLLDSEEANDVERRSPLEPANSPDRGSLSSGRDSTQTNSEESQADEMDSAFSLDLGPSILDAVLQVMDKLHQQK